MLWAVTCKFFIIVYTKCMKNSKRKKIELKANDFFCKFKRIKTARHLGTYSAYIQKSKGLDINVLKPEELAEIANIHAKMIHQQIDRKKGGLLADVAKNCIVSIPENAEQLIDRNDPEALRDFVNYVISDFLDGVKKENPSADIAWLKKRMGISLHLDTDHTHFHVVLPNFIKSKSLFKKYIKVDYSKRAISYSTRRSAYNYFKKILIAPTVTADEFINLATQEKRRAKRPTKGELRRQLEQEIQNTIYARYEAENDREIIENRAKLLISENVKWITKISNKLDRIQNKFYSGEFDSSVALDKLDKLIDEVAKTKDDEIKNPMIEQIEDVKNSISSTTETDPKTKCQKCSGSGFILEKSPMGKNKKTCKKCHGVGYIQ